VSLVTIVSPRVGSRVRILCLRSHVPWLTRLVTLCVRLGPLLFLLLLVGPLLLLRFVCRLVHHAAVPLLRLPRCYRPSAAALMRAILIRSQASSQPACPSQTYSCLPSTHAPLSFR
jgi:hypothetical protein